MKNRFHSLSILLLVVLVSILIMIVPTFFTKGISRVSLNKEITLALVLNDEKDIKIVFFGYSGCSDICTPRLKSLAEFYESLDDTTKRRVGVEFLDISVPHDRTLPSRFAEFFHKEFKGIYLSQKSLREYTRAFSIYFAQSLSDKTEYDHTTNIYLIKKRDKIKEIRYVYNSYPYDLKQINIDIKELLNESNTNSQ